MSRGQTPGPGFKLCVQYKEKQTIMELSRPQTRPAGLPAAAHGQAVLPVDEPQTFLTLRLGGQYFALSVAPVREILDEQPVATLPEATPDVIGLIDVRGESVIVMDVSRQLGVVPETEGNRRIVVLERAGDSGRPVGMLADQVLSVVEIANAEIEAAPRAPGSGSAPRLVQGIARLGGNMVLVLDHAALLGSSGDDIFDFGR